MRNITKFILALLLVPVFGTLLAVCAAGGGYWFGQHHAPMTTAVSENSSAPDSERVHFSGPLIC